MVLSLREIRKTMFFGGRVNAPPLLACSIKNYIQLNVWNGYGRSIHWRITSFRCYSLPQEFPKMGDFDSH